MILSTSWHKAPLIQCHRIMWCVICVHWVSHTSLWPESDRPLPEQTEGVAPRRPAQGVIVCCFGLERYHMTTSKNVRCAVIVFHYNMAITVLRVPWDHPGAPFSPAGVYMVIGVAHTKHCLSVREPVLQPPRRITFSSTWERLGGGGGVFFCDSERFAQCFSLRSSRFCNC